MSKWRSLFALMAAATAALTITLVAGPAQASGSTQEIHIFDSSHCLDNATQNAAVLQMWKCTGGAEQQWFQTETGLRDPANGMRDIVIIENESSKWCTYVLPQGVVVLRVCDASDIHEQWTVDYVFTPAGEAFQMITSVSSHLCLATSSVANGTVPTVVTCDVGESYEWWVFSWNPPLAIGAA
jgi:Cytolethal distending toxin A/C domain